jgi:hypothetical protein
LNNSKKYVKKASDPYTALISKIIDQNAKTLSRTEPVSLEKFKKMPTAQGLSRLQPNLSKVGKFDDAQFQVIRKKAIRQLCENDQFATNMIKDSALGRNSRYLNLLTDTFVNTFDGSSDNPHQFAKDFLMFSFIAYDSQTAIQNADYAMAVQSLIKNQLFTEAGSFTSIPSKFQASVYSNIL